MDPYYPLFWYALGFVTYHYLGLYGRGKRRLFAGGELDLTKTIKLK